MRWQDVRDLGLGLYKKVSRSRTLWVGGSGSIFGVFALLLMLTGVSETHSGDSYVLEDGTAEAYVNITTTYWRLCFNESFEFVYTDPKVPTKLFVPTYGKKWREFVPGKDCIERGRVNKFKIVGYDITKNTKWGFTFDTAYSNEIDIDPIWLVSNLTHGYHFTSGNDYNDSIGSVNGVPDGVSLGTDKNGISGQALNGLEGGAAGSDEVTFNSIFSDNQGFISIWANTTSPSATGTIWANDNADSRVTLNTGSGLTDYAWNMDGSWGNNGGAVGTSTCPITILGWDNLLINYNSTAAVFYLNGVVCDTLTGLTITDTSYNPTWVGAVNGVESEYGGVLDEFVMGNTMLTPAEVAQFYSNYDTWDDVAEPNVTVSVINYTNDNLTVSVNRTGGGDCSLWINNSWSINETITPSDGVWTNFTAVGNFSDTFMWNVNCSNLTTNVWADNVTNYTVTIPDAPISASVNYNFGSNISNVEFTPNLSLYNMTYGTITQLDVSADNQTSINPLYNVTVILDDANLTLKVNVTDTNYLVHCSNTSDEAHRLNLTTSEQTLCEIKAGNSTGIWCWIDYLNASAQYIFDLVTGS